MTEHLHLSRRTFGLMAAAGLALPRAAVAAPVREIGWEDLIPPGVPYSEIVADGEKYVLNDTWNPVFDENGVKLNTALDGQAIKLPGYMIPLEADAEGVTSFVLVPYVGACIHIPPPPPNQLVFVTTDTPWPNDKLWDAIWVHGRLSAELRTTELAEIGYRLTASKIELYQW